MKTVLFLSPTGTFDNGAEISIFNFQKYLVTLGYQVINVCPKSNDSQYQAAFEAAGIKVFALDALKWWWEDAPGPLHGDARGRAFYYREHIAWLRKLIRTEQVDVVITNTVNLFQGAVAAACEAVPHFWLIHEFPANEFAYYREKIDFIEEYSTEIFSVAGLLQEELRPLFTKRTLKTFIPYTELATVELAKGDKPRLVSVGRLTEGKNQLELLQAYAKLARPDLELIFIGAADKDYQQKCEAFVRAQQLHNVKFWGNRENPWAELTDQDLFVSSSSMETFGLVYVEALLNGLPAIISDNPGYMTAHEMFGLGQVYQLGNVDELANLIEKSLSNLTELKQESLSNLTEIRAKYSAQTAYQEIIAALENTQSYQPTALRHLSNILTLNDAGHANSLLSRVKGKVKRIIQRR